MAELAGIGSAWYTWLEQGRDIRPSPDVLASIGRALRLQSFEREYLLALALESAPLRGAEDSLTPALVAVMDAMESPAYVIDRRWELLAYNRAADAVFDYRNSPERNLLHLLFTPQARAQPGWEPLARRLVAAFRVVNATSFWDSAFVAHVERLRERSVEFRKLWAEHEIIDLQQPAPLTVHHPAAGPLRFNVDCLQPLGTPGLRLRTFIPAEVETAQRLAHLLQRRGLTSVPAVAASP